MILWAQNMSKSDGVFSNNDYYCQGNIVFFYDHNLDEYKMVQIQNQYLQIHYNGSIGNDDRAKIVPL
jgi:hypothetical protein